MTPLTVAGDLRRGLDDQSETFLRERIAEMGLDLTRPLDEQVERLFGPGKKLVLEEGPPASSVEQVGNAYVVRMNQVVRLRVMDRRELEPDGSDDT